MHDPKRIHGFYISVALIICGCNASASEADGFANLRRGRAVFYYIPFDTETLGATTKQNIENFSACTFSPSFPAEESGRILNMLKKSGKSSFDNEVVRLKITGVGREAYFVDRYGNIVQDTENIGVLSAADRRWLDDLLEASALDSVSDHCVEKGLPEEMKKRIKEARRSKQSPGS